MMATNGYQLFVRHENRNAVEKQIRAHVKRRGSAAVLWPDDDESDAGLDERTQRTFTLAPPTDDWITVWEDGLWADRLLAKDLSNTLNTEAIWLQLTEVTDTWAFAVYDAGEETERRVHKGGDPSSDAARFARERKLPFALEYLPPVDNDDDDDWLGRFESGEFDEQIDTPLDEQLTADEQAELDELGDGEEDDEEIDDDEAELEDVDAGPRLDSVRDDLVEFIVKVR
jgi:hypothetical protein